MIKKIIVSMYILFLLSFSIAFDCSKDGQAIDNSPKPPICEQTPQVIETYLSDSMYLINIASNWKPNYTKDVAGLWSKALNTLNTFEITNNVLWTFFPNFFWNFKILFEEKYIVRDWTKLINFKEYISTKVNSSLSKWWLDESLSKEQLTNISKYIKTKNSFFMVFKWTTKKELYKYLWKNQILMETIYYDLVREKKDKNKVTSEITDKIQGEEGILKEHLNNVVNKLKSTYFSNNWNLPSCSTSYQQALQKIKIIVCKYWVNKVDDISKRFKCNYNRLKDALWLGTVSNNYNCGSVQLAQNVPLKDRVQVNVHGLEWLKRASEGILKAVNNATEEIKNAFDEEAIKKRAGISDSFNKNQDVNTAMNIKVTQKPAELYKNMMISSIKQTSDKVIKNRDLITRKLQQANSNPYGWWATQQFVKLSKKIHKMIRKIDGDKLDDEWTIEDNLVKACENQSPYVWTCRKTKK